MRYLLDTNTISHLMRANPTALARLTGCDPGQVFISAITEAEIRFGLAKNPSATRLRRAVDELAARIGVLDFTTTTAREYGKLRAELEISGRPMSPLDTLIAATALEYSQESAGMTLVTNDRAFFRIRRLTVEDWTAPEAVPA